MELSQREWKRYKESSVFVIGKIETVQDDCSHVLYNKVVYGNNVQLTKRRSTSNDKTIWWEEINLPRIKLSYFLITTPKNELISDK